MLDRQEAERREAYRDLVLWVKQRLQDGLSREDVVEQLVDGTNWPRSTAEEFVRRVEAVSYETGADTQDPENDASGDFLIAAVAAGIGGGATWATFAAADPGGSFFVLWGPAVFGGWKFVQGLFRFIRYPTMPGLTLGFLALLVLVAAGLGLGVAVSQSEFGEDSTTSIPSFDVDVGALVGETSIFDLKTGDCFSEQLSDTARASVTLVSCDSPEAKARVVMVVDVPGDGPYPGVDYFDDQTSRRCPVSYDWFLYPTDESWETGDRTVTCLRSLE